ncbi:hypothetical protein MSAN_00280700 [Mycena sanguinolenta]|uniref:Uncharacterized protein n=1 Tax=Mycena sanguinolenta TaxID=230812 RepID=A0A8H6Z805_9AGAR|nr:hypothetical protein MSAN_00280700 [Mycena sanguinolenta]
MASRPRRSHRSPAPSSSSGTKRKRQPTVVPEREDQAEEDPTVSPRGASSSHPIVMDLTSDEEGGGDADTSPPARLGSSSSDPRPSKRRRVGPQPSRQSTPSAAGSTSDRKVLPLPRRTPASVLASTSRPRPSTSASDPSPIETRSPCASCCSPIVPSAPRRARTTTGAPTSAPVGSFRSFIATYRLERVKPVSDLSETLEEARAAAHRYDGLIRELSGRLHDLELNPAPRAAVPEPYERQPTPTEPDFTRVPLPVAPTPPEQDSGRTTFASGSQHVAAREVRDQYVADYQRYSEQMEPALARRELYARDFVAIHRKEQDDAARARQSAIDEAEARNAKLDGQLPELLDRLEELRTASHSCSIRLRLLESTTEARISARRETVSRIEAALAADRSRRALGDTAPLGELLDLVLDALHGYAAPLDHAFVPVASFGHRSPSPSGSDSSEDGGDNDRLSDDDDEDDEDDAPPASGITVAVPSVVSRRGRPSPAGSALAVTKSQYEQASSSKSRSGSVLVPGYNFGEPFGAQVEGFVPHISFERPTECTAYFPPPSSVVRRFLDVPQVQQEEGPVGDRVERLRRRRAFIHLSHVQMEQIAVLRAGLDAVTRYQAEILDYQLPMPRTHATLTTAVHSRDFPFIPPGLDPAAVLPEIRESLLRVLHRAPPGSSLTSNSSKTRRATSPRATLPPGTLCSYFIGSATTGSAGGSRSAGPSASCAPVAGPSGESRGSLGTPALLRGSSSNGPSRARVVDLPDVPLGPVEDDADMDAPEHAGPSEEELKEKTPPFLPGTASPVGAPPSPPRCSHRRRYRATSR